MAYLNLLAAVTIAEVDTLRRLQGYSMRPSKVVGVSHLVGMPGWVNDPPLQRLLAEALDGGEVLEASLWHPLRAPRYHAPDAVRKLASTLTATWDDFLERMDLVEDDWYRAEISKAAGLFAHASALGQGVTSILDLPGDADRATRVRIPLTRKSAG